VGCRRRAPTDELVRYVAGPDGSVVDGRGAPGRGAWVCRGEPACYERAIRGGTFAWALRRPGVAPPRRAGPPARTQPTST
jgi:predicted RNA-binding protein YlxR (DUF448 family)